MRDVAGRQHPQRPLNRRVLWMWWTVGEAIVISAGLFVFAIFAEDDAPGDTTMLTVVVAVAATLAIVIPRLRYRSWRYEIRERDLFLSRGALFSVLTLIPFDRIQYVETRQGPLDLAFGLMQLIVYTAAGKAARIPGLVPREAEALREELSKVAGTESV